MECLCVCVCEGYWIWRRFGVKLQVLVHFTHIYSLSMLFTVPLFLADSFCFIHSRSSVWDVLEMDQSIRLEGSYTHTPILLALELNPSLSLLIFLTWKKLRHCGNCQARSDPHMENSPSATQWHWLEPFQISTVYLSKLPVIKYGDYSGIVIWDPEQIYKQICKICNICIHVGLKTISKMYI